jgi:hypothetical protein
MVKPVRKLGLPFLTLWFLPLPFLPPPLLFPLPLLPVVALPPVPASTTLGFEDTTFVSAKLTLCGGATRTGAIVLAPERDGFPPSEAKDAKASIDGEPGCKRTPPAVVPWLKPLPLRDSG